jgi:hypothetical protein
MASEFHDKLDEAQREEHEKCVFRVSNSGKEPKKQSRYNAHCAVHLHSLEDK